MSLRDVDIKMEYRSLIDNIPREFYVPLLKEAVSYKRAVGFFSSTVLIEISKGIRGLIRNNGTIKLIASPNLSEEDIEAIKSGYASRKEIIKEAIQRNLKTPKNKFQAERLNLLANLIAEGVLDIRIAVTKGRSSIGIYHEKVGIIEDELGNKIAFSGSMNETINGLTENYETIDVFCNWTQDDIRVQKKETAFDSIWNNADETIEIIEIEEVTNSLVEKYRTSKLSKEELIASNDKTEDVDGDLEFFKVPEDIKFYDFQKEAISNWMEHRSCGVFDMATGTGKTFTALGAISQLSKVLDEKLAVVIVAPYQHLVEQWVEDIGKFNVKPIVAYSYKGQNWRQEFRDAVKAYNIGAINNFCIITTNASFMLKDFQAILSTFKKDFCFVADEAHNLGAYKISKFLPRTARYRLALSATMTRNYDEAGTALLYQFFGHECIKLDLKEAIKIGALSPYYYYPIIVTLNKDERESYSVISKEIKRLGYDEDAEVPAGSLLELLLIQRSRVVAGCREKVNKLIELIEPYRDNNHILVYCGATKYDRTEIDDCSDVRQIEEVNRRLYQDLHMRVRKFTAEEKPEERIEIKDMFVSGALQVVTAIKCLDEGVNIPAIKTAFILASSTNPKEYIQRRGRVLRKADGKKYAEIYDFITLTRPLREVQFCSNEEKKEDLSLVRKEFRRMLEFASASLNPADVALLRQEITETYSIINFGDDNYGRTK